VEAAVPVPQDVVYASQQMEAWLLHLKQRALLRSTHEAYGLLRAVLHELRDRVPLEDALRLADLLPPLLRGIMLEDWHPLALPSAARPPLFEAVSARCEHPPVPEGIVEDVLAVLAERTPPHQRESLGRFLPPEAREAWRRASEAGVVPTVM
jgi:uncharacterized protein (DUF2267 family)